MKKNGLSLILKVRRRNFQLVVNKAYHQPILMVYTYKKLAIILVKLS